MFRRTFAVAAAAACVVLTPGTASAVPDEGPAKNTFRADYGVAGHVVLPGDLQAQYSLSEYREASQDGWTAELSLSTWTYGDCGWMQCQDNFLTGQAVLDADDVHFSRDLSQAWATDVAVMLKTWTWDGPDGPEFTDAKRVVVSVRFDGIGAVSRDVHHGDLCSDGQTPCQATGLRVTREAEGSLEVDGQTVPTASTIRYGQYAETAPKPTADGGQPLPPVDGEYPYVPPVEGEYPYLPPVDSYPLPPVEGEYPYLPPVDSYPLPPVDGYLPGSSESGPSS